MFFFVVFFFCKIMLSLKDSIFRRSQASSNFVYSLNNYHNKHIASSFFRFLIPFSHWGDQYMSFDIGFDTILLLIATKIQSDRMHISAKIV